jgi:UDP-GlcNAc:undecaprenyl-phosphate GlcNAc-1-phosphate transferase
MVYGGGIGILDIGNPLGLGTIHLGPASLLFTILVTCTVINAFNFVDGIDGLAACLAIVAIAGVIFVTAGQVPSSTSLGAVACMSILGFLIFNFPLHWNARIRSFMGDAGSTMLGLVVVWLTTTISQGETRQISPVIGLWFAVIPLADFFTAFLRRLARGASPMRPDRKHLHHILLQFGLSSRAVLNIMGFLALVYATIGVLGHYLAVHDPVMFAAWSCVMISQYVLVTLIGRVYQRGRRTVRRTRTANSPG